MNTFLARSGSAFLIGFAAIFVVPSVASATTITFDDLSSPAPGDSVPLPAGYSGLTWSSNFYYLDGTDYDIPSGYQNGTISGPNVAFNGFGSPATVSSAAPFTLNSLYLTSAWNDGLNVTINGYSGGVGGVLLDTLTAIIGPVAPTLFTLGWANIDTIQFEASGGTTHYNIDANQTQFALDNLTINEPLSAVPLPATLPLLAGGLGLLGFLGWRRNISRA
jgi:hypothetical protein